MVDCTAVACLPVFSWKKSERGEGHWLAVGVEEQREMEKWRMVLGLELLLAVLGMGEGRGTAGLHLSGEQGAGEGELLLHVHEYAVNERDM